MLRFAWLYLGSPNGKRKQGPEQEQTAGRWLGLVCRLTTIAR